MHTDSHGWNWADVFSNQQAAIGMIARWTVSPDPTGPSLPIPEGRLSVARYHRFSNRPGPTGKSALHHSPARSKVIRATGESPFQLLTAHGVLLTDYHGGTENAERESFWRLIEPGGAVFSMQ
jgi:hypothetical protein